MTRKLKPAAELVSDIGVKAMDLMAHPDEDVKLAVRFVAKVNPEIFDWLRRQLSDLPSR